MTPEGEVKKLTAGFLLKHKIYPASKAAAFPDDAQGWYFMPVPTGYGTDGVHDFIGHYKGRFFSIETKAPGRRGQKFRGCSPHQEHQKNAINKSGALALVVDGVEDLEIFETWMGGGK
jgi:hypothetical protein